MTCKCGKEIANVPEHLRDLVHWVCKECSNAPPSTGLVSLTSSGELEVETVARKGKISAGHAA